MDFFAYVADTCFCLCDLSRFLRYVEKGIPEGKRGSSGAAVEHSVLDADLFPVSDGLPERGRPLFRHLA